ncbi:hypothetical protein ACOALZ_00575 [Nocardiopsis algeriensis]|uniref:hypothetical protein n=1 Tax=Nocardiopsis algeriensis TaxID=1478215 RepID=UPI003B42D8C1
MTSSRGNPDHYAGVHPRLRARAEAGVGKALVEHRARGNAQRDRGLLSMVARLPAYELIRGLLSPRGGEEADVGEAIDSIARALCEHRPWLLAALYHPLSVIPALRSQLEGTRLTLNHQWFAWCWTSEAAWRALHALPGSLSPPLTDAEVEVLVPVAARQRFLALSEAYRGRRGEHGFVPTDVADNLFGRQTPDLFFAHSRQARWEWAALLDRHEALPALGRASPREIEDEIDLLLFKHAGEPPRAGFLYRVARTLWGPPLEVDSERPSEAGNHVRPTEENIRFAAGVTERHLLPRYRVLSATRAAWRLVTCPSVGLATAGAVILLTAMTVGTALLSSVLPRLPLVGWPTLATAAAMSGATYGVGLLGITFHGHVWALPWLLRIPAAAAIGLLMMVTMHPSWWAAAFVSAGMDVPGRDPCPSPQEATPGQDPCAAPPLSPEWVALLLATAAFAYLLVNVRHTGVGAGLSLLRATGVWLAASAHAFLIALVGLAWVIPVFSENGHMFRDAWTAYPDAALAALLQAGSWCLAAGVFSQILWDDRPLTAPLAHSRWRAEER